MDIMTFIESNWFTLSVLASIIGLVWKVSKLIADFKKSINDRDDVLDKRISNVETKFTEQIKEISDRVTAQDLKREDNIERTRLIMEGVEATLFTLHGQGANGPVTKSLHAFTEYKNKKAAQ